MSGPADLQAVLVDLVRQFGPVAVLRALAVAMAARGDVTGSIIRECGHLEDWLANNPAFKPS